MTLINLADHGTIYLLAHAFAKSSTFQSVTDTKTVDDALKRVHYPDVEFIKELVNGVETVVMLCDLLPPRIVIADELGDMELTDGGIHSFRTPSTTFFVSFDFIVPEEFACEGKRNAWAWFHTKPEACIKDARNLGKGGDVAGLGVAYPTIDTARRIEGPYRMPVGERENTDLPITGAPPEIWHEAWEIARGM